MINVKSLIVLLDYIQNYSRSKTLANYLNQLDQKRGIIGLGNIILANSVNFIDSLVIYFSKKACFFLSFCSNFKMAQRLWFSCTLDKQQRSMTTDFDVFQRYISPKRLEKGVK